MDLTSIEEVVRPGARAALPARRDGDAFLAGGTWLFSEPQPGLRRLIDLEALGWPAVEIGADGVRIGATCTLATLAATALPAAWPAGALFGAAVEALWGSFKIHQAATVGGNLCLALPASPIAALAVALDASCEIWCPDGGVRHLAALDFVTGDGRNALAPGELLRAVALPAAALRRRAVLRRASLTTFGRSAALAIATRDAEGPAVALAITASVRRPVRIGFPALPAPPALAAAIEAAIDDPALGTLLHDDVHGAPAWRRHMTHRLAREAMEALA